MYISIKHLDRKYLQPNDMKTLEFLIHCRNIEDIEARFTGGKQFLGLQKQVLQSKKQIEKLILSIIKTYSNQR